MTPEAYIDLQPVERRELLRALHRGIMDHDHTVTASVGSMMGKEMILYHTSGIFKYGLASVKNYMSLHVMPMYGSPVLLEKFKRLLPEASFQKGCINFSSPSEMPPAIVAGLIGDCEKVDLLKIRQELQGKKTGEHSRRRKS